MSKKIIVSKVKIGVLMGGRSLECEVSFNSGRTVCDHLDVKKYEILPLFQDKEGKIFLLPWSFLHRGKISDFESRLAIEAELMSWNDIKKRVDIIFPVVHGRFAEDGSLQGALEVLNIPYVGSRIFACAIMSDKIFHEALLRSYGIKVPRSYCVKNEYFMEDPFFREFLQEKPFPLIVKPISEGSSFGVKIVHSESQLKEAVNHARYIDARFVQQVLIQEKIIGMEFSCIALEKNNGWRSFEPTEIVHSSSDYLFEYIDKYMPGSGSKYTPARLTREVRESIKKTVEAVAFLLGASHVIRVDGFLDHKGEVVILESNPFPGMAPSSFTFLQAACDNMSPADLIDAVLSPALRFYRLTAEAEVKGSMKEEHFDKKKMRVAVLLGGGSNEREISLESGRNVFYKLSKHAYEAIPLFMKDDGTLYKIHNELLVKNTTQEIAEKVTHEMLVAWESLPHLFDFVFIGLHGGLGENGAVQGILESLDLPYNGSSVLASSLCMDKERTKKVLQSNGLDVPAGFFVTRQEFECGLSCLEKKFENCHLCYPVIVKPNDDGCSCLVACCENYEEVLKALKKVFDAKKDACLVEELVHGLELTVGVIGNEKPYAFLPTYTPKRSHVLSLTEKFLPGDGENITPAPLSYEETIFVREAVAQAYKILGCEGYARLDCFFQSASSSPTPKPRLVFLECNSLPALTPATCLFHQAAEEGLKPMELIDIIVDLGIRRYNSFRKISAPERVKDSWI